jgi:dinuclear metal center YbgI/SA1388 family protein
MVKLHDICAHLDDLLELSRYRDASSNGLQVESRQTDIRQIACAVDAGESVIEQAVRGRVEMLIVHHGLFWGTCNRLVGPLARKCSLLLSHGCSLYASHLPLDGHATFGNGVLFAKFLGLESIAPAFDYAGGPVGVRATTPEPLSLEEVIARCRQLIGVVGPMVLPFGATSIQSIGIVTGSGSFAIEAAHVLKCDLLISGEPKQEAYHLAKEFRQTVLFAGHYATETFGVRALGDHLAGEFGITTMFINEETGI